MIYRECKIYYDGSHYIAIPHTERNNPRRKAMEEEPIIVKGKPTTRKKLFDSLYAGSDAKKKKDVKSEITEEMKPYFNTDEEREFFVEENFERKRRNLAARRLRMLRKAAMQDFNYFCTFTYDSKKLSEEDFRKKLSVAFNHLSNRKGWRYIGVWERSPEAKRLHFHGVFYIPQGTLPGCFEEQSDYSFENFRRQRTLQNTYFHRRFGRNVFAEINGDADLGVELLYMLKYIEKSGEKMVYSRGLPQFFLSDILKEDVFCKYGEEEKKLLLFDDFACYDQGEYMGQVSPEVIAQMRKVN